DLRPLAIRDDVAVNRHPNLLFGKFESEIRTLGNPDTQQALIGLRTGSASGVAVLDLDRKDGKDGIAACRARGVDPDNASPLHSATPSGGRHLFFRHFDGLRSSAGKDGIDVRADGGYVIIYHPMGNLDALPSWPSAFAPAPSPSVDPYNLDDLLAPAPDWSEIRRALDHVSADCGRDEWIRVGMALHHAGGGSADALAMWSEWSRTALPVNVADDREIAQQWRSFGKSDRALVTLGTLFQIAAASGYERPRLQVSADDFDDLELGRKAPRLSFLSPSECEAAPSRGYLIKGLFAPGDVGCIFGAPGAGKSLLAPFLGYAVAQGSDAFGMRTKSGTVFYIAAEDPIGMRGRVRALKAEHGDAATFKLVEGVADLLAKDSPDLTALLDAIQHQRPTLIFIDTMAMAFPGLEENDAKAMGCVVAVARKLAQWGAAVVLIHHDTKAEGATPRGHSLFNGALDVALHVKRDEGGIIRGKLTKNRNGTCDRDIAFRIATQDGGTDEDGDVITLPHCAVVTGNNTRALPTVTGQAAAALDVLKRLQAASDGAKVSKADWRKACAASDAVCSKDDPETRKKAFHRAVATLVRDEHVCSEDGFCWIDDGFDAYPFSDGQGHFGDMSLNVTGDKDTGFRDGQGHTP
ncbi:MAG: AAA family ATPase, partial [Roseinatronobacter sp.]